MPLNIYGHSQYPFRVARQRMQCSPTSQIREAEIWSALARAIEDQQLMFDEDGLGNSGTDAAATWKSGEGVEEVDEKDHEIAHIRIVARN